MQTDPRPNTTDLARRAAVELELRGRDAVARLRREDRGQGTVEYVALIMLVGALMAAVVAAGGKDFDIANTIGKKLKDMVKNVGSAKG